MSKRFLQLGLVDATHEEHPSERETVKKKKKVFAKKKVYFRFRRKLRRDLAEGVVGGRDGGDGRIVFLDVSFLAPRQSAQRRPN